MRNQHVVPRDDGWAVMPAGGRKASRRFDTKVEALGYADMLAKTHGVGVVVHGREGLIREFKGFPGRVERQHVVHTGSGWAVRPEGSSRYSKRFGTAVEAEAYAYEVARRNRTCMVSHRIDGTFGSVLCPEPGSTLFGG